MKIILNERDEQLIIHYVMLTRQLTKLADCVTHIIRLATQKEEKHGSLELDFKGYRSMAQTELSDVVCQAMRICEILNLNFMETVEMGLRRDEEKEKEYRKKHPYDRWI